MSPRAASLVLALLVAGCAKLPVFQKPAVETPSAWKEIPAEGARLTGDRWWSVFGDPALDRLVEEGFAGNRDLAIAAARIEEAQALVRIAESATLPSVDASAGFDRTRSSARSSMPLPPGTPLTRNSHRASLNVDYELDLWGRLRSTTAAARAELLATESARQTIRLALASEIVRGYHNIIALDMQIAVTRRTIELRASDLSLQRKRYDAGLTADFQVRQLEAELSAAQAQLPVLQQRRTSQEVALVTLLGRTPREIVDAPLAVAPDRAQVPLAIVPEGLPSDLLLRRPDIIEAEQRLAAANARIAVARAAIFPRIALTGFLGSESGSLGDLFSSPARIWQLAFALAQPIFQGGRLRAEIEVEQARERQAIASYQKTVQNAFGEVREALSAQTRSREAFAAETSRVASLNETLRLARIRFENGLSSQLEVLDAERNLLQAELNRIDALRVQREAVSDLVRALGGGWDGAAAPPPGGAAAR